MQQFPNNRPIDATRSPFSRRTSRRKHGSALRGWVSRVADDRVAASRLVAAALAVGDPGRAGWDRRVTEPDPRREHQESGRGRSTTRTAPTFKGAPARRRRTRTAPALGRKTRTAQGQGAHGPNGAGLTGARRRTAIRAQGNETQGNNGAGQNKRSFAPFMPAPCGSRAPWPCAVRVPRPRVGRRSGRAPSGRSRR